jgi:hypothetical protein
MSAFLVAKAIKDRLESDTGAGGLMNASSAFKPSGIFHARGSIGTQAYPYIVITVGASIEDQFQAESQSVAWTLTVYDDAAQGDARLWPIFNRIYGDAALQSSQRPTYGLHRHLLVLSTNTTLNPLGFTGSDVVVRGHEFGEAEDVTAIVMRITGTTNIYATGA